MRPSLNQMTDPEAAAEVCVCVCVLACLCLLLLPAVCCVFCCELQPCCPSGVLFALRLSNVDVHFCHARIGSGCCLSVRAEAPAHGSNAPNSCSITCSGSCELH
jgi:hypothetical protein